MRLQSFLLRQQLVCFALVFGRRDAGPPHLICHGIERESENLRKKEYDVRSTAGGIGRTNWLPAYCTGTSSSRASTGGLSPMRQMAVSPAARRFWKVATATWRFTGAEVTFSTASVTTPAFPRSRPPSPLDRIPPTICRAEGGLWKRRRQREQRSSIWPILSWCCIDTRFVPEQLMAICFHLVNNSVSDPSPSLYTETWPSQGRTMPPIRAPGPGSMGKKWSLTLQLGVQFMPIHPWLGPRRPDPRHARTRPAGWLSALREGSCRRRSSSPGVAAANTPAWWRWYRPCSRIDGEIGRLGSRT